jgi:predicted outer membrane repeat protein
MRLVGADPDVRGSVFVGNTSIDFGGAIECESGADPAFVSCVFEANAAPFGGALNANAGSSPTFHNCLFVANAGSVTGGAIRAAGGSGVLAGNCTFYANTSNFGAVIFSTGNEASPPVVANGVIFGNEGLENQLFAPNGTIEVLFSCVEGGAGGLGNIDADPMLADPEGGDLTLLPGSACVDAGANTEVPESLLLDLAGNPRLVDDPGTVDTGIGPTPIVDMGAYELQPEACYADFDGDGRLGVLDFVAFQQAWVGGDDAADCTGDGELSVLDFVCFQQAFVAGCP